MSFYHAIQERLECVFGGHQPEILLATLLTAQKVPQLLSSLEICADTIFGYRRVYSDVQALQSVLADDFSAFRFREHSGPRGPEFLIERIDNAHLHREIVDRTYELTTDAHLVSAQHDYTEAWKHYSKGDFDDALVNAAKAVESAAKKVLCLRNPQLEPQVAQAQLGALVPLLRSEEIFPPGKMEPFVGALHQLFQNSGALRNAAGAAHGSLDLAGPEASVTLLGLRIAGSLIAFLAESWKQARH